MSNPFLYFLVLFLNAIQVSEIFAQASPSGYLDNIKTEMKKEWPSNRTINLVFHGHSVPSGYFKTPLVNSFGSYPFLLLKELKNIYPNAVINVIITAKGGENSVNGEKRFDSDVLTHKPDVLFIDYALNDRMLGLEQSAMAMRKMITRALQKGVKVILLTPTPHQNYNLLDTTNAYEPFAQEIKALAKEFQIGLADSYDSFRRKLQQGHSVTEYMSQINHPNQEGHQLVAEELLKWFQ